MSGPVRIGWVLWIACAVFCHPITAISKAHPYTKAHPWQGALHSFVRNEVRALDMKALEALNLMASVENLHDLSEADIKKLGRLHTEGTSQMTVIGKALIRHQTAQLDVIQTGTGKNLYDLKKSFRKSFKKIRNQSELTDPRHEDSDLLGMGRLDPTVRALIRARIIEGGPALMPVVYLFELNAARVRLAFQLLVFSQAYAVTQYLEEEKNQTPDEHRNYPKPRMSQETFMLASKWLGSTIAVAGSLFPEIPDVSFKKARGQSGKLKYSVLDKFIKSFHNYQDDYLAKAPGLSLIGSFLIIEDTAIRIEQYGQDAFPVNPRKAESKRRAAKLAFTPEFQACAGLAGKIQRSDAMEGPPCDAKGFKRALLEYITFHEGNPGYGMHQLLIEFFIEEKFAMVEDSRPLNLEDLKSTIFNFMDHTHFNPKVRARWPKIIESLFKDEAKLRANMQVAVTKEGIENRILKQQAKKRKLTEEEKERIEADPGIYLYVEDKLRENGIKPMLGLYEDFNYALPAARDISDAFDRYNLVRKKDIERVDSVSTCQPFDDNDAKNGPLVVKTVKILPSNLEGTLWTDSRSSTVGFERMIWTHQVSLVNAVENRVGVKRPEMMAGLLRWTAMSRLLADAALTKQFSGDPNTKNILAELDIESKETYWDLLVQKRYEMPPWSQLTMESELVYGKMLQNFRKSYPELVTKGMGDEDLSALFRSRMRAEMALAASEMKKYKEKEDHLTVQSAARESVPEICRIFSLPPQWCEAEVNHRSVELLTGMMGKAYEAKRGYAGPFYHERRMTLAANYSLIGTLIPLIEFNYLARKIIEKESGQQWGMILYKPLGHRIDGKKIHWPKNLWDRVRELRKDFEMTPEMILEELAADKGVIDQRRDTAPERFSDLDGVEVALYQARSNYYLDLFGGRIGNFGPRVDRKWAKERVLKYDSLYVFLCYEFSKLQEVYDHAKSAYDRTKSFYKQAQKIIGHLFPGLTLEVDFGGEIGTVQAFEAFEDNETHFRLVLDAMLENNRAQIERLYEIEDARKFNEEFVVDLPLVDQMLQYFPDQKDTVCEVQANIRFWEKVAERTKTGVLVATAFTARMGAPGAVISAGVVGIVVVMDVRVAIVKARQAREARLRQIASWTQLSFKQLQKNEALLAMLDQSATDAAVHATLMVAFAVVFEGVPFVRQWRAFARTPGALGRSIRVYQTTWRQRTHLANLGKPEGFWKYWSKFGPRMWKRIFVRGQRKGAHHALRQPMRRWGAMDKWLHMTLAQRLNKPFYEYTQWYVRMWSPLERVPFAARGMKRAFWFKDIVLELPMSLPLIRSQWGNGVLATTAHTYFIAGGVGGVYAWIFGNLYDIPTEVSMDRMQYDAQGNEELMQLVIDGIITREELEQILLVDDRTRGPYLERLSEALSPITGGWDGEGSFVVSSEKTEDVLKAIESVEKMKTEVSARLDESRKGRNGKYAFVAEIWSLKKTERQLKGVLFRLKRTLPQ